MRRLFAIALTFALQSVLSSIGSAPAAAQTCTVTIGNLGFGSIDLTANSTYPATATIQANCTGGLPLQTVRVCANLSSGSAGADASGAPRHLQRTGFSDQLNYNLYQDAGHTTVWGSALSGAHQPAPIDVPLDLLGSGTAQRTLYAQLASGQQTGPSGSYQTSFGGFATSSHNYIAAGSCAAIGTTNQQSLAAFSVTAIAIDICTLSAGTLNFGTIPATSSATDASATLTTRCSSATPYTISLNGGLTGATNPAARKMRQGGNELIYGLYRDAARAEVWGSTLNVDVVSGSGTGNAVVIPVYGRVQQQSTPPVGLYSDTVIATIEY
jgi:spore coat protein U-like protein